MAKSNFKIGLFLIAILVSVIYAQEIINSGPLLGVLSDPPQDPPSTPIIAILQPFLTTISAYLGALTLGDIKFPILQNLIGVPQPPPQNISAGPGSFLTTRNIFNEKKGQEVAGLATAQATCDAVGIFASSLNFTDDPANLARLPYDTYELCLTALTVLQADPVATGSILAFQPPHAFSQGNITQFGGDIPLNPFVDGVFRTQIALGFFNYQLNGTINPANPLIELTIALVGAGLSQQAALVLGENLTINADGSFIVTVDSSPANGRTNHLQSSISTFQLAIIDLPKVGPGEDPASAISTNVITASFPPQFLAFFQAVITYAQYVGLLPPSVTLASLGQQLSTIAVFNDQVYAAFLSIVGPVLLLVKKFVTVLFFSPTVNVFLQPQRFYNLGFFSSQQSAFTKAWVTDTQAFVVTVNIDGAYGSAASQDAFLYTPSIYQKQTSLNNFQAEPNKNGTYTFVYAKSDPGVKNWVDTDGLNSFNAKLIFSDANNPTVVANFITEISSLSSVLPDATKLNAAQRQQQLQDYQAQYAWRYKGY